MSLQQTVLPISEALVEQLSDMAKATRGGVDNVPLLPLLKAEGLLSLLLPKDKGGQEVDWVTFVSVTRQLAAIYPVAGWLVATFNINGLLAERIPGQIGAEIAPVVVATGRPVYCDLTREGDRVTISGRWNHVLAAARADGLLASVELEGRAAAVMLPVAELELTEVGSQSLRGPGLYNVVASGLEVAADAVVFLEDLFAASSKTATGLYRMDLATLYQNARLGALVGAAEGAYQEYVDITSSWVGSIGGHQIAKFTQVQVRLAETYADLGAAGLMLDQSNRMLQRCIDGSDVVQELPQRVLRRNNAYVARQSLGCIERLVVQMGARGLMQSNPVQHFFLDIRTMAAHASMDWIGNMSLVGKEVLGLEVDTSSVPEALFVGG